MKFKKLLAKLKELINELCTYLIVCKIAFQQQHSRVSQVFTQTNFRFIYNTSATILCKSNTHNSNEQLH